MLFFACKDEDSPLSSTKQLNSFSILKGDNQGKIGNDVNILIVGNVLTLSMDRYDYSQSLAFIIEAEDGSKETYTVKVVLDEKVGFTSFRFLKKTTLF